MKRQREKGRECEGEGGKQVKREMKKERGGERRRKERERETKIRRGR